MFSFVRRQSRQRTHIDPIERVVTKQILGLAFVLVGTSCSPPPSSDSRPAEPPASSVSATVLDELSRLHRQGAYEQGLARTLEELETSPEEPLLHHNVGIFRASLGQYEAAIPPLEKALALGSDSADSHRALATAYTRIGELESSIHHFEQCLEKVPDDPHCRFQIGRNLSSLGLFADAAAHLQQATQLRPNAETFAELATTSRRAGEVDAALAAFATALELDPNNLVTLLGYGQLLIAEKKTASGQALLDRHRRLAELQDQLDFIERSGSDHQLEKILAKAAIFVEQGKFERAIGEYSRALDVQPNHPVAALELAHLLLDAARFGEAGEIIEQARQADPANPGPLFFQGLLELGLGQVAAASESFSASQRLGSWPAQAYLDVGRAYASAGIHQAAVASFRAALELENRNFDATLLLARGYYELGEITLADEALEACLEIDPNSSEAWFLQATLLSDEGNIDAAADAFRQGFAADPELLLEAGSIDRLAANLPNDFGLRNLFRRISAESVDSGR